MDKKELQKTYTEQTKSKAYESAMYAELGALGVSVKHLQLFEESMKLLNKDNN